MPASTKIAGIPFSLISLASFVVVVAGLKAAQSIVVPFILSLFLAVITAPVLFWLKDRKVPTFFAVAILVLGTLVVGLLIGALIGTSIRDFSQSLPDYQRELAALLSSLLVYMETWGISIPKSEILQFFDPGVAMGFVARTLSELSGLLGNAFLILLALIFMLAEASSVPGKLEAISGRSGESSVGIQRFVNSMKRYFVIKTIVSIGTGIAVWIALMLLGLEYAVLWGLLAFLLNYVPNIGSAIAAVPAVLIALLQYGVGAASITASLYIVINLVVGNVIEPRWMGRGLGLSSLVVFLSLVFWGWVLGPVGMLLSVPLTMTVKIGLEASENTRWLAVLLDSEAAYYDAK
jgi:predicted PurR-regulated permease PerM